MTKPFNWKNGHKEREREGKREKTENRDTKTKWTIANAGDTGMDLNQEKLGKKMMNEKSTKLVSVEGEWER